MFNGFKNLFARTSSSNRLSEVKPADPDETLHRPVEGPIEAARNAAKETSPRPGSTVTEEAQLFTQQMASKGLL